MTGENGGKEDGGKSVGAKIRRKIDNTLYGRSSEKEQPPLPQTPPAVANGNPMDSRTFRPPKRSQTADVQAATNPSNQALASQGTAERPQAHPPATSTTASTMAPNPVPAQTPATVPPTLIPGQGPGQAPPTVVPAKRSEREQLERIERPRSVDPQAQHVKDRDIIRELEDRIEILELHKQYMKERCDFYESEPYRQELLSIRTHLQVNDLLEPWQISQQFQAINKDIENVSRNLSEFLVDTYEPKRQCTMNDLFTFSQHRPPKVDREPGSIAIPTEDYIDFCCRSLVNEHLINTVLNPHAFHPSLNQQDNRLLTEMYESIRTKERQIIAGRWRISTFNAYKQIELSTKDLALDFCQNVLVKLCRSIYDDGPTEKALNKIFPEIIAVFERAWGWYSLAKSSVVLLDFEPFYAHPGAQYVPDHHALEGRKSKPPASGAILLTSRLGLVSSEAQGDNKPPTRIVQLKATVLAAEYFLSER